MVLMATARPLASVVGVIAALAVSAGCGDGPAAQPGYAATFGAGSRLKPTVLTIGGGVDWVEEWTDTQLGFRCAHRNFAEDGIAEDGVERCLPYGRGIAFSDPGCTMAIAVGDDTLVCPNSAQFAVSNTVVNECTVRKRIYRIASEIPTPARVYLPNGAEPCVEWPVTATATYFAVEAMPPSAFVAVNRTTRERAPGMRAAVWEGEDGSWEITSFFDESRGEACDHHYDTGEVRCVPSRRLAFGDNLFVDASCQMPAAEVTVPVCDAQEPRVGYKRVGKTDACIPKDIYEYHELVDTGTTGWGHTRLDDGTCRALGEPPGPPLYRVGSTISPASFPALQPLEYGSGRLRLSFLGFGGKPFVPHEGFAGGRFFDNEAGRPCGQVLFSDGKTRCVHGLPVVFLQDGLGYFAAPDCTGERIVELDDGMGSPCGHDPKGVRMDYNQCDGSTHEIRAVSRFTGNTLSYRGQDGTCVATSIADLSYSPYVVGEPLDPAALFPEIERVQRN
jgi:hypothetical protein